MQPTKFLDFDQAVDLSERLVNFSNSPQGLETFRIISRQTGLKVKDSYKVHVNKYERNCTDCASCSDKGCVLGCLKTPSFHMCYWDQALEKIIGTKLVMHEIGHLWFDQVFDTKDMDKNQFFDESEKFAQYIENTFTDNLAWCAECKRYEIFMNDNFERRSNPEIHNYDFTPWKDSIKRIIEGVIVASITGITTYIIVSKITPKTIRAK